MARKTKEEAEKTRQLLLQKAADVFLEKGIVAATLQDVAEAAGMTRGAVYWHFKNKADLLKGFLVATIDPIFELMIAEKEKIDDSETAVGTLRGIMRAILLAPAKNEETKRAFQILFHYYSYRYIPELDESIKEYFDCSKMNIFDELIKEAQEKGEVRADISVETLVFSCKSFLEGCMSGWLDPSHDVNLPLADEVDNLLDIYLSGIKA